MRLPAWRKFSECLPTQVQEKSSTLILTTLHPEMKGSLSKKVLAGAVELEVLLRKRRKREKRRPEKPKKRENERKENVNFKNYAKRRVKKRLISASKKKK